MESEEGWRREEVRGGMGGKRKESREVHIRTCTLSVHITVRVHVVEYTYYSYMTLTEMHELQGRMHPN